MDALRQQTDKKEHKTDIGDGPMTRVIWIWSDTFVYMWKMVKYHQYNTHQQLQS